MYHLSVSVFAAEVSRRVLIASSNKYKVAKT